MNHGEKHGATTKVVLREQWYRFKQSGSLYRVAAAVLMCVFALVLVVVMAKFTRPAAAIPDGEYRSPTENASILNRIPRSFEVIAKVNDSTAYVRDPHRNLCYLAWLTYATYYGIAYEHVPCEIQPTP